MDAQVICTKIFKNAFTISRIPTGKFNDSYYVFSGKKEYVLRIAPPDSTPVLFYENKMMRKEPEIHRIVQENTNIPVPEILDYDFSRSVVNRDWLLMKRIPGRALSEVSLNSVKLNKLFFTLGRHIKELHLITGNKFGYPESPSTGPMKENWFNAFRSMWVKILDDILKTGIYTKADKTALTGLLDYHSGAFPALAESSLLHMDIWSQNILTDTAGTITGIIDWDRALRGDPEIEYAVLEYCGTSPAAFREGYGIHPPRDSKYEIRRIFYMLYEHQKYIFIQSNRSKNRQIAERYARESLILAERLK